MKKLGYVVVGLIALVVVLVGGAFVVINAMSWNAFKGQIADAARDATGRELAIDGDLEGSLSLGLELEFAAAGVRLANAPGMQPADMVALGNVAGRVQLMPFLFGDRIVIDSFVVGQPVINLAVDAEGRPNWVFEGQAGAGGGTGDDAGGGGPPPQISIGELRVEQGRLAYADAVSGQQVEASAISVAFALTDLAAPLNVDASLVLNQEPVTLAVNVDSPRKLIDGAAAAAKLALQSKHVQASYDGRVLNQKVPGLDGDFALDVPSVGRLLAWLDQPLPQGQPDPGPLKVRASFAGEGAKVALTEATVDGESLKLKASGSVDASSDVTKVVLNVDSGVLDIDRYLPPPAPAAPTAPKRDASGPPANPLDALPDEPIDVSALRRLDADIKVALAGLKVSGLSFGKIGLVATAKSGVLQAELAPLALYGGTVAGNLGVDAKADAPAITVAAKVDKVKVDEIAKAATGEATMAGIANATVDLKAQGRSPRALAQALVGKLVFNLGDVKNAPGGALTGADMTIDLPGIDKQPSIAGNVIYNKQKVVIVARLDPLQKVLSSDRFDADVKLTAEPVNFSYAGAVQYRPVPGADGKLKLDVPSVGKLLAWLGQPLDKAQPDPGPLKVRAQMATADDSFTVKEATIEGKAIDATATLTLKDEKPVPRFDAQVDVQQANLNQYLPPDQDKPAKQDKPGQGKGEPGWSKQPIDFSGLKQVNGKAVINLAKVTYKNLQIDKGRLTAVIEDGVLDATVEDMALAKGTIAAVAKVDASGDAAKIAYTASVKDVQARPVLAAFAGSDRLSGKANIEAEGETRGASQFELVKALNGKGSIQFLNGAIHGINLAATLRQAKSLGMDSDAGQEKKTDFAELGGTYTIKNGVVDNQDFKLLAPLLRLSGAGLVPMPPQQLDYGVEAKLVASTKGQGGKDSLAGLPIPIKLTGGWADPQYTVDWDSVFKAMASDPERLANLPDSLADKAKDLGIALPGLGGAGGLLKGGDKEGGGDSPVGKLLQGVTGGDQEGAAPTEPDDKAAEAPKKKKKKAEESKPDAKDAAKDAIKGLLKRD